MEQREFESSLEWGDFLDEMCGVDNWVSSCKNDDGTRSHFYKTKNWTREFVYDPKTRIGEI